MATLCISSQADEALSVSVLWRMVVSREASRGPGPTQGKPWPRAARPREASYGLAPPASARALASTV
jgi:hypothetical protein